jgi:hypothetical protein
MPLKDFILSLSLGIAIASTSNFPLTLAIVNGEIIISPPSALPSNLLAKFTLVPITVN